MELFVCSDSLKTEFPTDLGAVWIDTINIGRFLNVQWKLLKNQPYKKSVTTATDRQVFLW